MKISELIEQAQEIMDEYGDLDVASYQCYQHWQDFDIEVAVSVRDDDFYENCLEIR